MALDTFNQEAARTGGTWVKLNEKGDHFKGVLLDIEIRDRMTPQGDVVLAKKSQKPRKVYVVTYKVDPDPAIEDDEGLRRFEANESAQSSIRDTLKQTDGGFKAGGTFTLGIKKVKEDEWSQHEYLCRYEPPAPGQEILADAIQADEEDPF